MDMMPYSNIAGKFHEGWLSPTQVPIFWEHCLKIPLPDFAILHRTLLILLQQFREHCYYIVQYLINITIT
ncbi:hypothetical protein TSAR_014787 [Trichomalopsis sarcophagae]|uniref:Uncharacterized protein n=1 Tax=Trichomalopsis sarcophagae TaxID=543379 RepID=A0A232EXC3_9HYME|nr:hypothetical protein TSAR_014787 [Trichomalopsis sarcophagae]